MSNERPDEFAGWAGRLEEPGGLAGQGLADKEVSWEKLHSRLGNPSRRRRFSGYRVAAACLLMVLMPAVFILRDRKPGKGQDAVARSSGTAGSPGATAAPPRGTEAPASANSAGLRPLLSPDLSPGRPAPARQQDLSAREFVSGTRLVQRFPYIQASRPLVKGRRQRHPASLSADTLFRDAPAVAAPPAPAANLVAAPAPPAAVKKELAVISINEIPDPVAPAPPMTGKQRSTHFRIGFGNPGNIRPALATQETRKTRVTIRLSSQNP